MYIFQKSHLFWCEYGIKEKPPVISCEWLILYPLQYKGQKLDGKLETSLQGKTIKQKLAPMWNKLFSSDKQS